MDIVSRYDIDGLHMDDYFYPYPSYNDNKEFPDEVNYTIYKKEGGKMSKGDWRRAAVNDFVKRIHEGIKKKKPHVLFGISPFGIWRPGHPSSIKGFDQYDQLYADVRLWIREGWMDYLAPQLYWPINQLPQSFPVLLKWWHDQNKKNKHVWPGINVAQKDSLAMIDETLNKIMISRGMNPQDVGTLHWSIAPHLKSDTLANALRNTVYAKKALSPQSNWIKTKPLQPPIVKIENTNSGIMIHWTHTNHHAVSRIVCYMRKGDLWDYEIHPRSYGEPIVLKDTTVQGVRLAVVDRSGKISKPSPEIRIVGLN
jgi:uncharacterized lipoprotein YddW (UPF0748 family)